MKNLISLIIILILAITLDINAQTKQDSVLITQVAKDYITGYFKADAMLMEKSLHPELIKRAIFKDENGNSYIHNLGTTHILHYANKKNKPNKINPDKDLKIEVIIFDIFDNIASVKVHNNKFQFLDYIHLGKFKEEWKIVNVLWARTPKIE